MFGNNSAWIEEAIQGAIRKFRNAPLEVVIVGYAQKDENLAQRIVVSLQRDVRVLVGGPGVEPLCMEGVEAVVPRDR